MFPQVIGETYTTPRISYRLWQFHFLDVFNFGWINFDTLVRNPLANVCDSFPKEQTLRLFQFEPRLPHG